MKVRISERSWHLQLVRACRHDYVPRDLCSYFWTLVAIIAPLAVVIGVIVIAVVAFVRIMLIDWRTTAVGIGIGIGVWAALFLVYYLGRSLIHRRRVRQRPTGRRGPNLIVAYVKAKKRRFCPLIEVVPADAEPRP